MRSVGDVIGIDSTKIILVERNTRILSPYCALLNLLQGNALHIFFKLEIFTSWVAGVFKWLVEFVSEVMTW
jgi:hypothetical protein